MLYDDEIDKKARMLPDYKKSKSFPIAITFLKVSEYKKNYWQHIFQSKYPLKTPLLNFATKDDLKNFIISSYQYRNKIAHVLDIKNFKLKPPYLRGSELPDYMLIEHLINNNYPYFVIFLIRLWLEKKIKTYNDWINFLLQLF